MIFKIKLTISLVFMPLFIMFFGNFQITNAYTPKKGNLKAIVITVDFTNPAGQVLVGEFNTLMFGTKPNPPLGSVKDYYNEVSYGQLNITGQVNDGITNWYRLPQPYSFYLGSCTNANGVNCPYPNNVQKMVEDAIALVSPLIDLGPFDTDNDGFVDTITVVLTTSL